MTHYSNERKEAVLKKLLPPLNMTVAEVARQERITPTSEQWPAETKLAVIVETATMCESELGKYCRTKGLFVEQIKRWKEDCLGGRPRTRIVTRESDFMADFSKIFVK